MRNKLLKNVAPYSIVKLNYNGVPVDFYVVMHNYEPMLNGNGRTLLARVNVIPYTYDASHGTYLTRYDSCAKKNYLNDIWKQGLDTKIQASIGSTTIHIGTTPTGTTNIGGQAIIKIGTTTASMPIFELSATELGGKNLLYAYADIGSALPNYTNLWNATNDSGEEVIQLTRTPKFTTSNDNYYQEEFYVQMRGLNGGAPGPIISVKTRYIRPCFTLPEDTVVLDDGMLVADAFPVISGSDGDLGTFDAVAPVVNYTVADEDSDPVSVTIKIDGVTKKTHAVTVGQSNTWQLTGNDWLKVLNGKHTIAIIADDGYVQSERTCTFARNTTSMSFTLATPLDADGIVTKALESIIGDLPTGASIKIEVCNNAYDTSPTWEDVTQNVLAGNKFRLTNTTKTADKWGYNVRVTVSRGSAIGDCYITSMGGFFE